jgi:hypothetical protein
MVAFHCIFAYWSDGGLWRLRNGRAQALGSSAGKRHNDACPTNVLWCLVMSLSAIVPLAATIWGTRLRVSCTTYVRTPLLDHPAFLASYSFSLTLGRSMSLQAAWPLAKMPIARPGRGTIRAGMAVLPPHTLASFLSDPRVFIFSRVSHSQSIRIPHH